MVFKRLRKRTTLMRRTLLVLLAGVLAAVGLTVVLPAGPATAAPCDAPIVSPVACENTKPGNPESEWGISGAGSNTIQGFATEMSVNVGETEGFKVDTPASSYRLDIYRMGYYGGLGARKVATVDPTVINNQPNCLTNSSTGLVDCGNWTRNAAWTVPPDAVSGVYFAKLVRTDGTAGSSHVFFVVRNDSSGSKLLFQTSDTTWQAYNTYGGNSLYVGSPAGRAYKVSYNRPFTTRGTGPEDFVFNAEYPMVRWLESNGYDVSYSSGADTDRRGAELLEHKTFLSVGHDEYWSGQQRANVEAARAAGVNLAFFSGNEIFWKTRWENSIDASGTPYRTLVSYKETHANQVIDPQDPPTWTGTWRDPRFSPPADGGRPENALSGTIFTANCCDMDMVVGSADGKMRFWRNTRVANLAANATTTVGTNIVGYEWDEDADNGSRPPGLIRLSQTTGGAQVLQDYGSTYAGGTATHSMTLYRAASGALVFGAGSVQWAWALDSNHDRGSGAADAAAQQATVNLFADMGVQPTTMQAGLTAATASTDTTAPTSTITAPADNTTVPVGGQITVTGTAADTGGGRVGGIEVSTDNGATWHRATGRESWSYTFTPSSAANLTIRSRATDDSGNIQSPTTAISVTVGSGSGSVTCPCTIWPSTATPAGTDPDTAAVELGVKFRASQDGYITGIRYYKPTQTSGTHVGTLWTGTGTKLATATFTNETASGWQQALFSTPVPVTANTTYVASYFTPSRYVVSSAYFTTATTRGPLTALQNGTDGGNGLYRYGTTAGVFPNASYNSENYWVDVVYQDNLGPDTTKPTVTSRTPAVGATNVAVGVAPTATFSEPVTAGSISFQLRNPAGTLVTGTTAYDTASRTATLTPGAALQPGTVYTATVSGAADASGNVLDPVTWTFTTAAADTTKPTMTARTPAVDATNVAVGVAPTATFSEPVTAGSITFQLRNPAGTLITGTTAYAAGTQTATLTPGAALQPSTVYTATVSGAADASGNVMDPVTWSFTTAAPSSLNCPCTIWPSTATPAGTDPDTAAVELGVKFRASQDGYITGIRYYKPTPTSGTHVGTLWTGTGTKLATATFTNETASGWQQALFSTPVPVTANTTYVASYFTPSRYVVSSAYFTTATTRGPLTALQNGTDGGNGLYRYGTTAGVFPNASYNSENYWVDVVYQDNLGPDTTKPTVTSRTPAVGATNVAVGVAPTATFSEPVTAGSISFQLRNPAGTLVTGTTAYDTASRTATLTPGAALQPGTVYTATVSGAADASGNVLDPVTWTFTTAAADTTKPTMTARTPAVDATNVAVGVAPTATFSEPVTAGSITFQLRNPAGTLITGTTAYAAGTQTATLTPGAALQPSTVYTATVSGAADASGNVMDPVTWSFTTAAPSSLNCPCTIWPSTATPAGTDPDTAAVELGVKFRASQDGYITGIRYYKPTQTSGTHVGTLWTGTGTKLATATFTNETASGWQQALFSTPVPVTANTTYVASYFTPSRYVVSSAYFTTATTRGPLTALQNGTDGGNGLYRYGTTAGVFPNASYNSENYWVDVVYQDNLGPDTTAPSLLTRTPAQDATGVPVNTLVTATYNEALRAGSATVELRDAAGTLVAGNTTIDTAGTRVAFEPGGPLQPSTTYDVRISGASDASGNVAPPVTWSFQTAAPAPPPPDQGPGGPIAVVTSNTNPVSTYLAEIMRAEGLNEFSTIGAAALTAGNLASYRAVVIGDVPVTDAQVTAVTDWVNAGGNLVLMHPDSRFLSLAGLTAQTGTVSDGYLAVDGTTPPGAGITTETMQFHGTANRYALSGATTVATLYTSATASTGQPAVAWRAVGTNGGQVATFAFDLARSVVLQHQGNPAWANQERDGQAPIRSDDLFFGGSGGTDWVNLSKVQIPQADEQQRLLANLITVMSRDGLPIPRFWYFPDTNKAVVVATGDDHASGGTAGRFDSYLAASPAGCSVAAWTCPRFTSYVYPATPLTNNDAATYTSQGFEVGLHHTTNCLNWSTLAELQNSYSSQLADWRTKYSSIPSPTTNRTHCITWSDWDSQPKAELANGIRLDTNYYFWPGSWVADRPGFMNGSGIPMRFTDTSGSMIDVYQTQTVMTDESGQSYPFTPNTLLDRALGAQGYYGAFTANVHTDSPTTFESTQLLASAQARGVPLVTARQMLTWVDGRNASSFNNIAWSGQTLSFSIAVGSGASRLTAMLPTTGPGGSGVGSISRSGTNVAFTRMTVKGQEYAVFPALSGTYTASYSAAASPSPSAARVASVSADAATVAWSTDAAATSTLKVGTGTGALKPLSTTAESTTRHRVRLDGLEPGTTYHYRVLSRAAGGTTRTWPAPSDPPATFRTPSEDSSAPAISSVRALSLPDGTMRVTWTTSEPATSQVRFGRQPVLLLDSRRDDALVRRHEIVLTGLASQSTYWLVPDSSDAAGNSASGTRISVETERAGVAVQTAVDFRTGTTSGDLRVSDAGLGALALPRGGTGGFVSSVLDAQQKVHWLRSVVAHSAAAPGSRLLVSIRTGSTPTPDGTWTRWRSVTPDGAGFRAPGRYLQFRLRLATPAGKAFTVTAVGFTHDGTLPVMVPEGG